jgi:hypothetical protein
MGPGYPMGAIPPAPTAITRSHHRPSVIAHLLGLDGMGRWGEARRARAASAHAATRVGNPAALGAVSELPASVVYGR